MGGGETGGGGGGAGVLLVPLPHAANISAKTEATHTSTTRIGSAGTMATTTARAAMLDNGDQ
jgi:mevalonate kinase